MSGRKTKRVSVPRTDTFGRDAGKVFALTEMPAARAEKWALRLFLALKGSSQSIPENIVALGMVGVAIVGLNIFLRADVDPDKLEPLLDEMMTCVQIVRDPKAHPEVVTDIVSDDDIEEVQTRAWLRSEVLELHTGFSPAAALWNLISAVTSKTEGLPTT